MVMNWKSYEEIRLQTIEENNRRILPLNLNILALNLKKSPKSSSKEKRKIIVQKTLEYVEVRRSARNSDKPASIYRDVVDYRIEKPTKKSKKPKTSDSEGNYPMASTKERKIAIEKAKELELSLGDEFSCFVKPMHHSHVNIGFWLGLPSDFSKKYLPKRDAQVTLVDEEEVEFATLYLAEQVGLIAGWRGFAIDHQLIKGDSCVFQRTKPIEFKVYVIRANDVSYGEESS
ncbi:hypothetical protein MKW94_001745 [Papaver nudicaule]|uniref:TF-B3 domain-containing protein n=1 Tax=Papaver nudicaule TaxID=74823 RepID=A0AA42ARU4_PAPNU|nr:hypothetical protein [Papaver nudicaule]